ncbi:MAG: alanine racemase [Planctomycetaceae bacterium]|nr:alanine racemase [Planctomycetaceae bacterium]
MHHHRVWAEIDCDAIAHNYRALRGHVAPATKIMAVLKADAYGHGAVMVAKLLEAQKLDAIGVGDSQEALELRDSGINLPILILGTIVPGEIDLVIGAGVQANLHSLEMAREIAAVARRMGKVAEVQLKIDTGMGRLGADPYQAVRILRALRTMPNLKLRGINTHFSSAGEASRTFTERQLSRFLPVVELAKTLGYHDLTIHAANHAAAISMPHAHFDMVRPGLALYGLSGAAPEFVTPLDLKRVLTLKTQVAFIKDVAEGTPVSYDRKWYAQAPTRIATLPVGYNDGLPVQLTNRAQVLIHGRRAPMVGRIAMDYVMVDVGAIPGVKRGDIVTLIGRDGNEEIKIEELANLLGTVPYAVSCGLGRRVRRVYTGRSMASLSNAA